MNFFVYGTLRQNQGNHGILTNEEYLGIFKTKPEYTLKDLGYFPAVEQGGITSIIGEVYNVTDTSVIKRLYRLEGYDPEKEGESLNFYELQKLTVTNDVGVEIEAYMFYMPQCNSQKTIPSGDWLKRSLIVNG